MTAETQIKENMNRMYRLTRHVYDASRKYYLLGRDHLIGNLAPKDGEYVCEVGCGTARNLIKLAKKYPGVNFYGIDASDEMLKTAQKSLAGKNLKNVRIAQAYAQSFKPGDVFGIETPPAKIFFSYSLSMIPSWRESINHALGLLPANGEIHIVDFGDLDGLPKPFRKLLFWWLKLFHVYHKPEILEHLKNLEEQKKGTLKFKPLYKGYVWYTVFTRA